MFYLILLYIIMMILTGIGRGVFGMGDWAILLGLSPLLVPLLIVVIFSIRVARSIKAHTQ